MSARKHWEKHNFLCSNRKTRKWKDLKTQNNDSADFVRFVARFLSNLAENLAESLQKVTYKDCKSSPEYMTAKDGLLNLKCVDSNKTYEKKFDEDLSKNSKTHISSALEMLKFIHRNTYMAGKSSIKHCYP